MATGQPRPSTGIPPINTVTTNVGYIVTKVGYLGEGVKLSHVATLLVTWKQC